MRSSINIATLRMRAVPPDLLCLPIHRWPETDQTCWKAGTTPGKLFAAAGAGAKWSPRSRIKAEHGYGRWLQWLFESGFMDSTSVPAARVTQKRVEAYIAELALTLAPYSQVCRLQELYDALRVLEPGADWSWLRKGLAILSASAQPTRDKCVRLRPVRELVELGEKVMQEAQAADAWSLKRRARHYRDGLIIALLAYRALRVKNFSDIRIGRHLVSINGTYWLLFDARELKSRRPYEAIVPASLVAALERYLHHYRPLLLKCEGRREPIQTDALWISQRGTPLAARSLPNPIVKHTRQAFGMSLPAHWFRDAVATTIAVEAPKHVRDAGIVFGPTQISR